MDKLKENKIIEDLLPQRFGKIGQIWVASLIAVCTLGVFAYGRQLYYGLEVTAMRDYVSWGIYISNFVFFVFIYAFSYFRYEPLVDRFLLFILSFVISMIFLVTSGNTIMLFLGWELIGFTSFCLINF